MTCNGELGYSLRTYKNKISIMIAQSLTFYPIYIFYIQGIEKTFFLEHFATVSLFSPSKAFDARVTIVPIFIHMHTH